MLSLNKNRNNGVDSLLVQNTIRKIACCMNDILIINNISYYKKFFLMIELW